MILKYTIDNESDEELQAFEDETSSEVPVQQGVCIATSNTSLLEEEIG